MTALPQNDFRRSLVGDALRRRWPIVLITAAVIMGAVGLFAFQISPSYTSTAQVLLRPTPGNALSPDSAKNAQQITVAMETEAGLVNSPPVAAYVSKLTKLTFEPASPDVDAVISPNTQIVEVSYTGDTPAGAQSTADAYAKSFLQFRLSQTQQTLDRELRQLKNQEKVAQDNLKEATADASIDRPTAQAVARVQLYSSRLASTQDLIGETNATDTNPGAIIIPASSPTQANGISPVLLLLAAGLLGIAFGLALAIWRERTDDRIRATAEPSSMGLPILGYVPSGGTEYDKDRIEAFRQIRAGVLVATDAPVVLAVAPVSADIAMTASCYTTAELARSLSDSGRRVVVVDATAPVCGLAQVLGTEPGPGLMTLLSATEGSSLADQVSQTIQEVNGLFVIPAGKTSRDPADLVAGDRLPRVLEELRGRFDVVLLAAPAATSSHGNEACMAADATVLVVTERRTRAAEVGECLERAGRLGIRYLGLVALSRRLDTETGGARSAAAQNAPESTSSETDAGAKKTPAGTKPRSDGSDGSASAGPGALAGSQRVGQGDA